MFLTCFKIVENTARQDPAASQPLRDSVHNDDDGDCDDDSEDTLY